MPIPVARLKEAEAPLEDRALDFLKLRPQDAFSLVEIYVAIEHLAEKYGMDPQHAEATFRLTLALMSTSDKANVVAPLQNAIEKLVKEGKVVRAKVGGIEYYAIRQ